MVGVVVARIAAAENATATARATALPRAMVVQPARDHRLTAVRATRTVAVPRTWDRVARVAWSASMPQGIAAAKLTTVLRLDVGPCARVRTASACLVAPANAMARASIAMGRVNGACAQFCLQGPPLESS